jgi:hypothetical protein
LESWRYKNKKITQNKKKQPEAGEEYWDEHRHDGKRIGGTMLEHCERKFTVYQMRQVSGGGYVAAYSIDDKVRYCPFCGQLLATPVPPEPPAEEAASPRPKRNPQSKAGQAE